MFVATVLILATMLMAFMIVAFMIVALMIATTYFGIKFSAIYASISVSIDTVKEFLKFSFIKIRNIAFMSTSFIIRNKPIAVRINVLEYGRTFMMFLAVIVASMPLCNSIVDS